MEISGKRVLITGASQGLGEATAREFASRGATVALAARSTAAIERLADELGGRAYTVDLSDADQVEGIIGRVESDGPDRAAEEWVERSTIASRRL
jgi:NADP-dependent 3-hydroxy acid dehydrogenase YdfG